MSVYNTFLLIIVTFHWFPSIVFQPTIDMLCDPDYINQKLYNWLEYREKLSYEQRRTYTHAATYEEYMKIIENCKDIEHLKQMR